MQESHEAAPEPFAPPLVMKMQFMLVAAACAVLVPVGAADAAKPKPRAVYGEKTPPNMDTGDPTLKLRIARDGKTLDAIGPHEHCDHGAGGFNVAEFFYPKVDDVRIARDGSFKGSESYVQEVVTTYHQYEFSFKVTIKGRFVTTDRANGTFSWQMSVGGERSKGVVTPCNPQTLTFTARRGKNPGYFKRWHPAGQAPPGGSEEES